MSQKTAKLVYVREFTLSDVEERIMVIEFLHTEDDLGNGTIDVVVNKVKCRSFCKTLLQLMDEPIRFYLPMNGGQLNEIEYYYGRENAGCHIKVN